MRRFLFSALLAAMLLPSVARAGRSFNGTSDCIQSSGTIDLSGTNVLTYVWSMIWPSYANDDDLAAEFSSNFNSVTTGFLVDPNSSSVAFEIALKGDVGYNTATYTRPSTALHHFVAIFDKSQAANEVDLYIDASLQTPTARANTSNNTNNFGNHTLYLMSRACSSLFASGTYMRGALWSARLTQNEITSLYRCASPATIRFASLEWYQPTWGVSSPEPDLSGNGNDGTVTGAAAAPHVCGPEILTERRPSVFSRFELWAGFVQGWNYAFGR